MTYGIDFRAAVGSLNGRPGTAWKQVIAGYRGMVGSQWRQAIAQTAGVDAVNWRAGIMLMTAGTSWQQGMVDVFGTKGKFYATRWTVGSPVFGRPTLTIN